MLLFWSKLKILVKMPNWPRNIKISNSEGGFSTVFIFHHVTGNFPPITRNTVWNDFPFALSQEIFFL